MIVNNKIGITSPKGFLASGINCGIKKNNLKPDLAFIYSEVLADAAGVFTKNEVKGAPIYISKSHLSDKKARGIIVNSGNANTCTGEDGLEKAKKMASLAAKAIKAKATDILVSSTGVIGVPLNIDAIKSGIPLLINKLSIDGNNDAANAIMTTDTFSKELGITFEINNKKVTIGAIAKGSGMIEPNMGTMLSFLTTDLNISGTLLQEALSESTKISYNRVSVDGDTSTNDMVLILANGLADNIKIEEKNEDYYVFLKCLNLLNIELAKLIAQDGEGATKLIECTIKGAKSEANGEALSKSVINSNLVKTAMFGSDANWGRILCALGYSKVYIDTTKIDVSFKSNVGEITVCKNGIGLLFDEVKAKEILMQKEVSIIIDLKIGDKEVTSWGCDLSYEYVRINGDYRS
ncbi:bifunctional glutamate N-acetyltransferase/amino-acid acetyltransferase ArgJ [Clostridium sp.]|uniref:bifunctional glutamate N-acetyltransferase/amino-acid acetyltransferase ArgJ n=1 Tax=Clostridium sp. TaxID=1506 RepID=UPI003F389E29